MPLTVSVVGASGKTGRAVRASLEARGVQVRGIGRAEWPSLEGALRGSGAAYVIAPNLHPDEPAFVAAVLAAAREAGIQRIGYHSVAAPYVPSLPHHLGKAVAEDLVRRSGLAWTLLQPCAYVQNLVPDLQRPTPALTVPYDVDAPFGLVDLADVGEAAATVLLDDTVSGATYELGGPRTVTLREVAATAAAVLGRPVPLTQVAPEDWQPGPEVGAREATWLRAMFAYYDRHGLPAGPLPLTALLGRTPTSVEATLRRCLTTGTSCASPAQPLADVDGEVPSWRP